MKMSIKIKVAMADRFEGALDRIPTLDKVPFSIKREAAEAAAQEAFEYLRRQA
jgi:hypothetical protein